MHIPDGFLSTPVWATLDLAAAPAVGYVVRRAQRGFDEAQVPLLGVMGAFVFAAQMINFPVGIGTTGHLVGGALLAYTLGPFAAGVVMSAIIAIQALIFQDGGLLALGPNIVNMAILGVLAGYLPFHLWGASKWRRMAIFAGGPADGGEHQRERQDDGGAGQGAPYRQPGPDHRRAQQHQQRQGQNGKSPMGRSQYHQIYQQSGDLTPRIPPMKTAVSAAPSLHYDVMQIRLSCGGPRRAR